MKIKLELSRRMIFFLAGMLVVMIGISILLSARMNDLLRNYMEVQVENRVQAMAQVVDSTLTEELKELHTLSEFLGVAVNSPIILENLMKAEQDSLPEGVECGLLDIYGHMVWGGSQKVPEDVDLRDCIRGKEKILCRQDGSLLFAVPVFRDKNVKYVLYRLYGNETLADNLLINLFEDNKRIMLVNLRGGRNQILIDFDNWERYMEEPSVKSAYDKVVDQLLVEHVDAKTVEIEGARQFLFCVEIPKTSAVMTGLIPYEAVNDGLSYITYLVVWVFSLIVFLIFLGVNFVFSAGRKARESDELRVAKEEAERATQIRGTFMANMSHEIRTPINAVIGLNEMILRESKEPGTREYAMRVRNASQALMSIINDILDFTRIDSGKTELIENNYELSDLIRSIHNMISVRALQKGLFLEYRVDRSLPSELIGDEVRIRQVLSNLLTNAVKYTPEGKVELVVRELDRTENPDGTEEVTLHIEIRDTGIGIKSEDVSRLFEAFERLDETKNHHIEGTGLGIAISERLLRLMDSGLQVESVYGLGSVFSFDLKQKIANREPVGDVVSNLKEMNASYEYQPTLIAPEAKILAVDDTPVNLYVLEQLLKETKVQVVSVESGKAALEQLAVQDFHLIMLDHMMPEMDGIETLKLIREQEQGTSRHLPIVAMTANAVMDAKEMYLANGFDDFLPKPISQTALEHILKKYLPAQLWQTEPPEKIGKNNTEAETLDLSGASNRQRTEEATDGTEKGDAADITGATDAEPKDRIGDRKTADGIEFPPLPGFDWQEALTRLGNARLLYNVTENVWKNLDKTAKQLDALEAELETEENVDLYRITAHGMKSSAAMIGAVYLAGQARDLEYAARDHKLVDIHRKNRELTAMIREIKIQLSPMFGGDKYIDISEADLLDLDKNRMIQLLLQLKKASAELEFSKMDEIIFEIKKFRCDEKLAKTVSELHEAVTELEFDDMTARIEQIQSYLQQE